MAWGMKKLAFRRTMGSDTVLREREKKEDRERERESESEK